MFGLATEVRSEPAVVNPGGKLSVNVQLKFAANSIHLNGDAPCGYTVEAGGLEAEVWFSRFFSPQI